MDNEQIERDIAAYRQRKRREQKREWAAKNKDRTRSYCKKYYQTHREACLERGRKWRAEHPAKAAASQRKYVEGHREQIYQLRHAYYLAHREELLAYQRAYRARKKEAERDGTV